MALIPGVGQAVNINSINNGPSNNGDPHYIQYDGFTTALTAISLVQPGETYHLTIAIAYGGDGIYDSGIFLKTNNLQSNLSKYDKSHGIKVYPNPNKGRFVLENRAQEDIRAIEVIGSDGRTLDFNLEQLNDEELKMNIEDASPGVYWIKLITEEGAFYSTKFVID
jgi:hypothetical protein